MGIVYVLFERLDPAYSSMMAARPATPRTLAAIVAAGAPPVAEADVLARSVALDAAELACEVADAPTDDREEDTDARELLMEEDTDSAVLEAAEAAEAADSDAELAADPTKVLV